MSRLPLRGPNKRQKQSTTRQKYLEAQEKYFNGQFTYDTHTLIQNIADKGRKEPNMEGVPVYRTLIQVAKILMMNELEVLFLGATIEQMKWKIIDNCLNNYIQDFKSIVNLKNDNYNKKVQLSLLLIGYVVKVYLNETEENTPFEQKIREMMEKDYDKMYQEWVEKMKKNFKFFPKSVNKLFRQLDIIKTKKQSQLDDVNYNYKVEQLFKYFLDSDQKHQRYQQELFIPQIKMPEQEQSDHHPILINNFARTQSIQSLRSFGRRDSDRSDRDFGIVPFRNIPSIFRNSSIDEPKYPPYE